MAEARPRHVLSTLLARFDGAVMSVTPPGQAGSPLSAPTAAQQTLWAPLQAWCLGPDAGTGLSVAVWTAPPGSPEDAVIEAFSRYLDGSHQLLAAGGALPGLLLRLRVKACDVAWWRPRRATDPWDSGYVLDQPAVRAALAGFNPRRATLMVALDWSEPALIEVLGPLARSAAWFQHPVRWLVVQRNADSLVERLEAFGLTPRRLQPPLADF